MNEDLALFEKEFTKYQKLFGLTDFKAYFKYVPLKESFASLSVNHKEKVATVALNSKLPKKDDPHKDVKRSAKHEALHLLLSKLEREANSRFTIESDIYEEVEGLANKLEDLIDG